MHEQMQDIHISDDFIVLPGLEPLDHNIEVSNPMVKDGLLKYYVYSVKVWLIIIELIIYRELTLRDSTMF